MEGHGQSADIESFLDQLEVVEDASDEEWEECRCGIGCERKIASARLRVRAWSDLSTAFFTPMSSRTMFVL